MFNLEPIVSPPPDSPSAKHQDHLLEMAYRRTRSGLISLLTAGRPLDEFEDAVRQHQLNSILDRVFDEDWQGWSSAVCREAVAETPGVVGVGISLATDEFLVPIGTSDTTWTPTVEEVYLTYGEGPAIDVIETGRSVMLESLNTDETRWPGWIRAADRRGVRGLWCHPLAVDDVVVAALSFYLADDQPPPIDGDSEHVRSLVELAERFVQADLDRVLGGDEGFGATDVVHVAAGMLAIQFGIGTDEAIARLRARAFATGKSLTDAAGAMVERRLPFM